MAERRYLDEPFLLEISALEQAVNHLRPLARTGLSPLPLRLRNELARIIRRLSTMRRELRQQRTAIRAERQREDVGE